MRWTIAVEEHDDSFQATASWANDGEVAATCQAGEPAECVAGVAAALTSLTGRLQVAQGIERSIKQLLGTGDEDEDQQSGGRDSTMPLGDVAIGILSPLLASGLTYGVVRTAGSRGEIVADDRVVGDLNEDLRRWVRDRDRGLDVEHAILSAQYNNPDSVPEWRERVPEELRHLPAGSQYYSGAHVQAHADAQRRALHEYRDEASRKLRAVKAQVEREGRLHRDSRGRRARNTAPPAPPGLPRRLGEVAKPAQVTGMEFEAPIDDPTRPELEPELAELEHASAVTK